MCMYPLYFIDDVAPLPLDRLTEDLLVEVDPSLASTPLSGMICGDELSQENITIPKQTKSKNARMSPKEKPLSIIAYSNLF